MYLRKWLLGNWHVQEFTQRFPAVFHVEEKQSILWHDSLQVVGVDFHKI